MVHLVSPDGSLDSLFTSNYALLQIRDELARLDGVGDITVFGAREYSMRIWLDPDKLSARGLTAQDVVSAIQEQNVQVAAGIIGAQPVPKDATAFQYTVSTQGRLADEKEFGEIVVKTGSGGQVTRVRDVARVELAARDYTVNSQLGGKPATAIGIFQRPGSNALETSETVRKKMDELKQRFPAGMEYTIVYDPTVSVRESIHEVQKTLLEAIALVVLVVLVFLQTWRATIIPLIAIPVSLIGTFAAMSAFGFSINNISLFGLVLAIGIVVDDAIVVVEAIEHHIEHGLSPRDAARKAMTEVGGALVAIALVLCAVFIPTAFLTGITGEFFRQFALTIAVSTAISALNSLTLSPALARLLLRPRTAEKDRFQRLLDFLLGWFFKGFNKVFAWAANRYGNTVGTPDSTGAIVLLVYGWAPWPDRARDSKSCRAVFSRRRIAATRSPMRSYPTPPRSIARKLSSTRSQRSRAKRPAFSTRWKSPDSICSAATRPTPPRSSCLSRISTNATRRRGEDARDHRQVECAGARGNS